MSETTPGAKTRPSVGPTAQRSPAHTQDRAGGDRCTKEAAFLECTLLAMSWRRRLDAGRVDRRWTIP